INTFGTTFRGKTIGRLTHRWGDWFRSFEAITERFPKVVEYPEGPYSKPGLQRPLSPDDLERIDDRLTLQLAKEGIPPSSLGTVIYYEELCGGGGPEGN